MVKFRSLPIFHVMKPKLTTMRGDRDGAHLLVIAGVHGDECEPMVAARRLLRRLRFMRLRGQVTVIPILNEDARRRKERTGGDGLDLARTFPGRADGSLTEQVAFTATQHIGNADCLIDMHTGGNRYRIWPLAGYMVHPNSEILECQREMARAFNLPVVWGSDPALEGRTLSAARDANVPAIYVEYLGAAPFCRHAVRVLTNGCLQTMASLEMIDWPLPANQVRYWAEDARSGAGHLQACHPAPFAGTFEAAVELGENVEQGQMLGRFSGIVGERMVEIVAEQSGRIVCLAAPVRVEPGDGLVVIVEFENA